MRRGALTEGRVGSTLLGFSLPFLLSNLLQALYGATDLFMVGRFADPASICAVATGSQVMQMLTGLVVGLTTGGTVRIAQHYGARRGREAANSAATMLGLFGGMAVGIALLFLACLGPVCRLMQVPLEALGATREYLFVCSCGIVFIVGYNVVSGILRGMGDSRTPLMFVAAACVTNIAADYVLVGRLHLGALGAAAATVFAQAASLVAAGLFLLGRGYCGRFRRWNPRPQVVEAKQILGVGGPIAMQDGLVNLSFLAITAIINAMGITAAAAVGVAEKLIMFSMLPTTAFASAVAAMTAQNSGAGKMCRARRCLRAGILFSLVFGVLCFALAQGAGPWLVGLFTNDTAVIAAGDLYLKSYSLDCVLVCLVFNLNSYFSGSGHAVFPLVHSLIATFAVRIPVSYWLSRAAGATLWEIGTAAPGATLLSLVLCAIFYEKSKKKPEIAMEWN